MAYEAKFVIAAENRVKEATDAAQKDFEGFGGKVKEALSTITVTAGDVMNAIKGVSSTVTEWINAYAEDERALITLKTALEATGQASGDAVGKLTSFASSLQAVTGIGDEATNALSARLIASGLSVEQTMKLIKAAADYSAATGEDFNSTVDNLQRTLSGTAGRISGFIPELKGLSKEQLQSGAAIDLVAEKYGGFAEKLVGTASVSLATFNAAWGDMKEALGTAIMPAVRVPRACGDEPHRSSLRKGEKGNRYQRAGDRPAQWAALWLYFGARSNHSAEKWQDADLRHTRQMDAQA